MPEKLRTYGFANMLARGVFSGLCSGAVLASPLAVLAPGLVYSAAVLDSFFQFPRYRFWSAPLVVATSMIAFVAASFSTGFSVGAGVGGNPILAHSLAGFIGSFILALGLLWAAAIPTRLMAYFVILLISVGSAFGAVFYGIFEVFPRSSTWDLLRFMIAFAAWQGATAMCFVPFLKAMQSDATFAYPDAQHADTT